MKFYTSALSVAILLGCQGLPQGASEEELRSVIRVPIMEYTWDGAKVIWHYPIKNDGFRYSVGSWTDRDVRIIRDGKIDELLSLGSDRELWVETLKSHGVGGKHFYDDLVNCKISAGMSQDMVRLSWRHPDRTNVSTSVGGKPVETWFYGRSYRHQTVKFVDDKVVAISTWR